MRAGRARTAGKSGRGSFGSALSLAARAALPAALATAGALSAAHYRAFPHIPAEARRGRRDVLGEEDDEGRWPGVSIVVPARNEERTLPALLASLAALDYPDYKVIVVDDASTDATGALARVYAAQHGGRWHVVRGAGPPAGWTGKTYACAQGAAEATGAWLLFTDADTVHAPASLRAAIHMARQAHVRALSLFTRQRCHTFWERLLLPLAYQQYFVGMRPARFAQSGGPALANGHYFLIERAVYDAIGGHGAVAGSIIDDVALAEVLAHAGYATLVCRGERLVEVRMYEGLRPLVEGFTKNSAQFVHAQGMSGAFVVASTACAAGVLPTLLGALRSRRSPASLMLAAAAYIAQVAGLAAWVRQFGVPLRYALLAPIAALVFTGIALSSALHALTGRPVRWKERLYLPVSAPTHASERRESRDG